MKICFIAGAFTPMKCGVGDYTYNLCKSLKYQGCDIEVITSTKCDNKINRDFVIHNIVEQWNFNSKDMILNKLKEINPDIVHIQYPSDEYGKSFFINFLPRIIKKELGIKVVETVHEYLNYTAKGKVRNLINYIYADELIVVEEQYISKIKGFLPFISKKLNITYIPISSNIPVSSITKEGFSTLKEELGLKDEKIISYFGFINELKGFETLLESFKEIVQNHNKVKLLVLSEVNEKNDYHNKMIKIIKDYNIESKIIIVGFIESSEKVANLLKISDLCILPFRDGLSERNGSFLAVYNQGIPIITTSKEDRKHEDNVFYVKPGDSDGIIQCAKGILKEKIIVNRNILSWDEVAHKHKNIYGKK
jgi:glycosyltransferase involved in cell wall biosynthesis